MKISCDGLDFPDMISLISFMKPSPNVFKKSRTEIAIKSKYDIYGDIVISTIFDTSSLSRNLRIDINIPRFNWYNKVHQYKSKTRLFDNIFPFEIYDNIFSFMDLYSLKSLLSTSKGIYESFRKTIYNKKFNMMPYLKKLKTYYSINDISIGFITKNPRDITIY